MKALKKLIARIKAWFNRRYGKKEFAYCKICDKKTEVIREKCYPQGEIAYCSICKMYHVDTKPVVVEEEKFKDEIDLKNVAWIHPFANCSDWPITSDLKVNIHSYNDRIDYDYDWKLFKGIPHLRKDDLAVNFWVFEKGLHGYWNAYIHEWGTEGTIWRPKSTVCGENVGHNILPHTWEPKKGVQYGFMVSSLARDNKKSPKNQRTKITVKEW